MYVNPSSPDVASVRWARGGGRELKGDVCKECAERVGVERGTGSDLAAPAGGVTRVGGAGSRGGLDYLQVPARPYGH